MKRFSPSHLRVRLLLLVMVAVIPAWGLIVYTASEQRRLAVADIQKNALRLAEFTAREEDHLLQGTRQILIAVANFIRKEGYDPSECNLFCADLLKHFSRYTNIGAVKPNGDVFCSAIVLDNPANAADRIWFQHAMQTLTFTIGDYQVGRISGKPVLVLAYPLVNPEGNAEGVAFAAIDLLWLNRYKFEIESQLPEGSTITQIDENGMVLAHQPNSEQWIDRSLTDHPLFKQVLLQKKGVQEASGAQGSPYIYAFAPLQSAFNRRPVYVIVGIPKKFAFADSNRILTRTLILLGFVAMLAPLAVVCASAGKGHGKGQQRTGLRRPGCPHGARLWKGRTQSAGAGF
jgi:hypothetical protein